MAVYVWLNKKQGEGVYYLVDRDPRHPNGRKMHKLGPSEEDRLEGERVAEIRNAEAKAKTAAVLRMERGLVAGEPVLGEDAFQSWWAVAEGGYSRNHRRTRRWLIFDHLIPRYMNQDLRRLMPEQIAQLGSELARVPRQRGSGTLGWHSVRQAMCTFRRLLRWLERQEHLEFRDPLRGESLVGIGMKAAESAGARRRKRQAWSQAESEKILAVAAELRPDFYPLLYTALHTGMRKGELLALEWGDLNLAAGRIDVNKSRLQSGAVKATKTGKERRVDICDGLRDLLERMAMERLGRLPMEHDESPIFCTPKGGPRKYDTVHAIWEAVRTEAHRRHGVRRLAFHCFRHTFASWGLRAHADTAWLAMQLGHDTKILLDVYAHFVPEDRVPHFLNSLKPGGAPGAPALAGSAAAAVA